MPDQEGEIKKDPIKRSKNYFYENWREWIAGALMILGIVLTFLQAHVGGILVGLSVGIYFYEEIRNYFMKLKNLHTTHGTFKTLMIIGGAIFFLITIPAFFIAGAIGFGIMYLVNRWQRH